MDKSILNNEPFDEEIYLAANPDVAAAVESGTLPSGRHHYEVEGRAQGRICSAAGFVLEQSEKLAALNARRADGLLFRVLGKVRRIRGLLPAREVLQRRAKKVIWWTITGQLPRKLRQRKLTRPAPGSGKPHFAPPVGDFAFAVPFPFVHGNAIETPNLAVVCHLYYPGMLEEIKRYLSNIPFSFDLFITTDTAAKQAEISRGLVGWNKGAWEVRIAPNRGRDIAPKLITCRDVYDKYEFFLHIHSKKSPQLDFLSDWRTYLLDTLLGSPQIVQSVFSAFAADSRLGMVAPEHFDAVRGSIGWGWNFETAKQFAKQVGIRITLDGRIDFPSGSMFWGRSAALGPLLRRNLSVEDFPPEAKQLDATLGHVIERLYYFVCEKAGYRWLKVVRPDLSQKSGQIVFPESDDELQRLIPDTQFQLLQSRRKELGLSSSSGGLLHNWKIVHAKSDLRHVPFPEFCEELRKHIAQQESRIDFDEKFYLTSHPDIAQEVARGAVPCGYVHYCLCGQFEGRIHSDRALKRDFGQKPVCPSGFLAPVDRPPVRLEINLDVLPDAPQSTLLILFSHLQEDLFFAGYAEFFRDYSPVFSRFRRVVISVEHPEFDKSLAMRYSPTIEVIHRSGLGGFRYKPQLVVAFNAHLTHYAHKMMPAHLDRIIYYCQDLESGFFPFGLDYIIGERAIANSQNLVVSTEILKNYLEKRGLITDQKVHVTCPRTDPFHVAGAKTKKLFFYYRPEMFHKRNLPEVLKEVVLEFCEKYTGYEIYMVGTVATSYSYKVNGTQVYVLSKLPKEQYLALISSCDVVVSLIYAAHPGVIAYHAAASGIPTVTNVFENRSASLLKRMSANLVPYDPVRDSLLAAIETALQMPKGQPSFHSELYGGIPQKSFLEFHDELLAEHQPEHSLATT
jgi:hypothetical protein